MTTSDGSTASYYELPEGCSELQDLISHRDMNAQIGEIFRACYRYGQASHSDRLRDAKKMRFYAQAEIERLERLGNMPATFGQQHTIEPASAIDDESERQKRIQQSGELAEEVYAAVDGWVKWSGGFDQPKELCGVRHIDVTYRDGSQQSKISVAQFRWYHNGGPYDVIAYRICKDS